MNFVVTGGAGYIGSGVMLRLLEEFPDSTITSIDNLFRGDYRHIDHLRSNKQCRLLKGDIRRKSDVQEALGDDTKAIIHLAALPGIELCKKQPEDAITTNVYGTYMLLEELLNRGGERFVFVSSAAVYGVPQKQPIGEDHPLKPVSLYGVTKVSGEQLVNSYYVNHGLATTILRLSNVYGLSAYTYWKTAIPKFVWQAVNNQPLTVRADGQQQRDFVHVKSIIDAIIQCLRTPREAVAGETFNLGGEDLTVNQIAGMVMNEAQRRLGKRVSKVSTALEVGEVYTPRFSYSCDKAFQKIGYKARWKVGQGISELFEYALKTKTTENHAH